MVLTFLTHKLGKKMFVQKSFWSKFRRTLRQKPVTPGMLTFATTWATGSLLQQMWLSDQEQIDWQKCGRYLLYGGFFIAPTFYAWIRLSSVMYPKPGIKSAVAKTILEQITYTPLVISSFFFGMSLMEGKDVRKSMKEVSAKFLPTYHVGLAVMPAVTMINFKLIPKKHRVSFISCFSLLGSMLLAYVKDLDTEEPVIENIFGEF